MDERESFDPELAIDYHAELAQEPPKRRQLLLALLFDSHEWCELGGEA